MSDNSGRLYCPARAGNRFRIRRVLGSIPTAAVYVESKRSEYTLHKEELHNCYAAPYVIRATKSRMGWEVYVARMGEMRNVYKIFVGKPGGKRWIIQLNRDWWRDFVNTVMNLRVPGRTLLHVVKCMSA
jgi:hypothetical protein